MTLLEYRDAKVVFEVDDWFSMLPQAVKRYLLPLQSKYAKWYDENVRHLTQNYAFCSLCKQKESNLQRHYMQHHVRWRSIWFCPIPGLRLPILLVQQGRFSETFAEQTARAGYRVELRTQSGKANSQSELFLACKPNHGRQTVARIQENHTMRCAVFHGRSGHGVETPPHPS